MICIDCEKEIKGKGDWDKKGWQIYCYKKFIRPLCGKCWSKRMEEEFNGIAP